MTADEQQAIEDHRAALAQDEEDRRLADLDLAESWWWTDDE